MSKLLEFIGYVFGHSRFCGCIFCRIHVNAQAAKWAKCNGEHSWKRVGCAQVCKKCGLTIEGNDGD